MARQSIKKYSPGQSVLLISPLMIFLIIFYLYPLITLFPLSLIEKGEFSIKHYAHFFGVPLYVNVLIRTIRTAIVVTFVCFILGYPVAYFISEVRDNRISSLLLICVLLPFWTSVLVKTYTWVVLLQSEGLINSLLVWIGIVKEPLKLLYNEFAVIVGMVHILLPFIILPIYSVLKNLDRNLNRAARNLGASPLKVFLLIVFPLSLPGVAAGVMFVFILALGFYVAPAILGGANTLMIATLIDQQINRLLNWEFASAIAVLLLLTTVGMIVIFNRIVGLDRLYTE